MSAHSRRSTLYGPHAVLHRHRRPVTARNSKESNAMNPSEKLVKGGQWRTAQDVTDSAGSWLVCVMVICVMALVVGLPHVVALVERAGR